MTTNTTTAKSLIKARARAQARADEKNKRYTEQTTINRILAELSATDKICLHALDDERSLRKFTEYIINLELSQKARYSDIDISALRTRNNRIDFSSAVGFYLAMLNRDILDGVVIIEPLDINHYINLIRIYGLNAVASEINRIYGRHNRDVANAYFDECRMTAEYHRNTHRDGMLDINAELNRLLNARQRRAFTLYLDGYTQTEISNLLSCSQPMAKKLIDKAVELLKGSKLLAELLE